MDEKWIMKRISEVENSQRALIDLYSEINEMDAEVIKKARLKGIQVQIGKGANYLKELNKQLSEVKGD